MPRGVAELRPKDDLQKIIDANADRELSPAVTRAIHRITAALPPSSPTDQLASRALSGHQRLWPAHLNTFRI
jgi:hypothetical protein